MMDPFSDEPDSAELLMMDMEIPEPMRQEDGDLVTQLVLLQI